MRRRIVPVFFFVLSFVAVSAATSTDPVDAKQRNPERCFGARATILVSDGFFSAPESDDVIVGNDKNNKIFGRGGDDRVCGRGAGEQLSGNAGDDSIAGGRGNDQLFDNDGGDLFDGGRGDDRITATEGGGSDPGIDEVRGGDGDDTIFADDGVFDRITCGRGRDTAFFDAGLDVVTGCEIQNPPQS